MNLPFRRDRNLAEPSTPVDGDAHVVTSDFNYGLCRFVLDCSCGDHFDTPYIDEALEYHELHVTLAPLADQLSH